MISKDWIISDQVLGKLGQVGVLEMVWQRQEEWKGKIRRDGQWEAYSGVQVLWRENGLEEHPDNNGRTSFNDTFRLKLVTMLKLMIG